MTWDGTLEPERPTPAAVTLPRALPGDSRARRYSLRALESECRIVAETAKGGRNDALNVAALKVGQLVAGGGLERGEAIDALTAAAKQCGLADHEIRATLASGMKAGEREPRTAPELAPRANGSHAGPPPDDDFEHDDSDAPDAASIGNGCQSDEPEPHEHPTRTDPLRGLDKLAAVAVIGRDAIETLASEPVAYAWQDITVLATIALIAGPPSGGKTTLLFLVLAARLGTTPVRLLGRDVYPADPAQYVVLIEGEHSESSAARKLVKSLDLLDVDHSALDRIIILARKAVRLGSPEWADVGRLVAAGLVSDIAIDTVARVMPADGSSEQEQVAIFDAVAKTIDLGPEDTHPTVWAVSHTRKNGTSGDVDDVSGSTQRVGQADSVLLIKPEKIGGRTVSTTVTFVKLREDPEDRWPAPAEFAIVTVDGERELRQSAGSSAPDDDRPLETRITDLLGLGAKTKSALANALSRSRKDVDEALTNLFSARAIRTVDVEIGGRPRKAFELVPASRLRPDEQRTRPINGRATDEPTDGTE